MSKPLKFIQQNLRHYAEGKSNYALSQKSGVSEATISKILTSDDQNPTIEILHKLALSLGISVADLVADPENRPIPSDILTMLEGQDTEVYITVRNLLKALIKNKKDTKVG